MTTVEPRLSRGLRDLLPDQMLARQRMIDTIRGVYESKEDAQRGELVRAARFLARTMM